MFLHILVAFTNKSASTIFFIFFGRSLILFLMYVSFILQELLQELRKLEAVVVVEGAQFATLRDAHNAQHAELCSLKRKISQPGLSSL